MKKRAKTKAKPQARRRRLDQLVQLLIGRGWKWIGAFGHQVLMPPEGDPRWNWAAWFIPYGKNRAIPHWAEHELNPGVHPSGGASTTVGGATRCCGSYSEAEKKIEKGC